MGLIESFGLKRKQEAEKFNPSTEPKGPALTDILGDKEKSRLFGAYLEEEGAEDLARELHEGKPVDSGFIAELNKKRTEFVEICNRAETISKTLDLNSLNAIIESSPELKEIANLNKAEGIRDVIRRYLPEIAIRDRSRFAEMEQKINQLAESQKKITESEEKIKKFVKKYGISEEQYSKFIESGDDEKLKDLIWGKLGFFTKLGWNATKRFDEELSSAVTVEDINLLLANRDTSLKEVGGSLRASLVGNETLNKALIANLKRESMEKPEADMSFGEFGKALKPEKEAVKKLYDQFKQENFADYQSQGLTEDDLRTDFVKGYANKVATKGKKGFWTSLFGKLFAPKIIEDFLK